MKRFLLLTIAQIFLNLAFLQPVVALNIGLGLEHYSREMEFYYQKPRPEMIPGLLSSLDKSGQLDKGENRLMTAAFLSELAGAGALNLKNLPAGSRNLRQVLAWSARLAQIPGEKIFIDSMLDSKDRFLAAQINSSPAPLAKWQTLSEKTVLQMFWAAFMAGGKSCWLDKIIAAALAYARCEDRGERNCPAFGAGAAAAASLYEFAPRHPLVAARLRASLAGKSAAETRMLRTILEHAGK